LSDGVKAKALLARSRPLHDNAVIMPLDKLLFTDLFMEPLSKTGTAIHAIQIRDYRGLSQPLYQSSKL
jgi:hypothetical protein